MSSAIFSINPGEKQSKLPSKPTIEDKGSLKVKSPLKSVHQRPWISP